ncbi:hypothetical protein NL676_033665 [Syzygium grande]|nr:hypothetical protein NL676_033665 [Syzygium grande]
MKFRIPADILAQATGTSAYPARAMKDCEEKIKVYQRVIKELQGANCVFCLQLKTVASRSTHHEFGPGRFAVGASVLEKDDCSGMSTVLDSPLVALASDYTSFGFLAAANNLWTWIVVISTVALSFWRIRASALSAISRRVSEESLSSLSSSREDEIVNADRPFPQPASSGAVEEEFESGASTPPSSSFDSDMV